MAEITKVLREHLPALRFIGKRYTEADRVNGGYGRQWGEWFASGRFVVLEKLGEAKDIENGYLGLMRDGGCCGEFEYWIGMFFSAGATVPEGFEHIDLDAGEIGVCWIYGSEGGDGNVYSMHDACMNKLRDEGMGAFRKDDKGRIVFFERYNCPRFTEKDDKGNVILDYGVYLA